MHNSRLAPSWKDAQMTLTDEAYEEFWLEEDQFG